MRKFKKLAAIITAASMAITATTTTGMSIKAAEADVQEDEIIPYSGTLTKSTEGRFYISVNEVKMISITQYATWTYQGAASVRPNCTTHRTVVGRMINADGTCVWELGNAYISDDNNGGIYGTKYVQDVRISLWGRPSQTVKVSTTFFIDGSYQFDASTTELNFK